MGNSRLYEDLDRHACQPARTESKQIASLQEQIGKVLDNVKDLLDGAGSDLQGTVTRTLLKSSMSLTDCRKRLDSARALAEEHKRAL